MTLALETAIEGVETIYSKHDELRALQSLDRLIESSEIASKVMIQPREPLLIINQAYLRSVLREYVAYFNASRPHDLRQSGWAGLLS